MRKNLIIFSFLILIVTACQSVDISSTAHEPLRNNPVNVFEDTIKPQALGAMAVSVESGNLFSNGGFESGLEGWGACDDGKVSITDKAYEGSNALSLESGNCFYQSVEASAEQEFNLSCFINVLSGEGWTGMGLSFSDANWNMISEPAPAVISSTGFNQYNVSGIAPANTSYVSMWLYSDNPTVVDNCSLMLNEPAPPPPPAPNSNLLENGGFESANYSENWLFDCASLWSDVTEAYEGNTALAIQDGTCVDQSLSASDVEALKGQDFTYSCYVKNPRNYGSISIFFDNQPIYKEVANSNEYQLVEITGTAPANLTNGFVSAYADDLMFIDNCSLTFEVESTIPEFTFQNQTLEVNSGIFDIEGNTMAVGFPEDDNTGKVVVYKKTSTGWIQDSEVTSPSATSFGSIVVIHDGILYIRGVGPRESDGAIVGTVYIYAKNSLNQWTLEKAFYGDPSGVRTSSTFGTNILLEDNLLLIGFSFISAGQRCGSTGTFSYTRDSRGSTNWQFTSSSGAQSPRHIYKDYGFFTIARCSGSVPLKVGISQRTSINGWQPIQELVSPDSNESRFGTKFTAVQDNLIIQGGNNLYIASLTDNASEPWKYQGKLSEVLQADVNLISNASVVGYKDNRLLLFNGNFEDPTIYVLDASNNTPQSWSILTKLKVQGYNNNNEYLGIGFGLLPDEELNSNTFGLAVYERNTNITKRIETFDIP